MAGEAGNGVKKIRITESEIFEIEWEERNYRSVEEKYVGKKNAET